MKFSEKATNEKITFHSKIVTKNERKIANNKNYRKIKIKSWREHISNIGFNESLRMNSFCILLKSYYLTN